MAIHKIPFHFTESYFILIQLFHLHIHTVTERATNVKIYDDQPVTNSYKALDRIVVGNFLSITISRS